MKKILLLLGLTISLLAYNDYDMDGVEDKLDMCPNTSFNDLTDINGCSIKSLVSQHNFDIIYGISSSEMDSVETISQNIQMDYYYKNFSVSVSSSYYDSDVDSGSGDSFLGANYKLKFDNVNVRVGVGIILPTDKADSNNNADYASSLNLSYPINNMNLFCGYSFTKINDDDTVDTTYQNTSSYNIGIGFYPTSNVYINGSYGNSDSVYKDTDSAKTFSIYSSYSINSNWFTNLSYALGLNDEASDNYTSLSVGYYFGNDL